MNEAAAPSPVPLAETPQSPEAPQATESPAPLPAPSRRHPIRFTGCAREYFRIWAVNLALTVVTLGVYSPWAKVRKKRYFYGHTRLGGDSFEYRGEPMAIFKGRIVAVAVAGLLFYASRFDPRLLWVALPSAVFLVPWLVVRSFAFNARNSAWRNVTLRFDGGYWACWRVVFGYGLLTLVTLGLGYFRLKAKLTEFGVRNHAFGATRFATPNLSKPFSAAYFTMIGLGFVGTIALSMVTMTALAIGGAQRHDSWLVYGLNALTYLMYLGLFAFIRARVLNATWNNASLGAFGFACTLRARGLFKLYFVNVLAILATLGLATPWAVMRTLRYRAEHLALVGPDALDGFEAAPAAAVGASGEEVGEFLDMDFSL
jgi:uncharacterized membrane protein YjgN (DUF898 family)